MKSDTGDESIDSLWSTTSARPLAASGADSEGHVVQQRVRAVRRCRRTFGLRQDHVAALHRRAYAARQGAVLHRGQQFDDPPPWLSIVFQDYNRSLFPWLSVRQNVAFGLRRFAKRERDDRVRRRLRAVNLRTRRRPLSVAIVWRHAAALRTGALDRGDAAAASAR